MPTDSTLPKLNPKQIRSLVVLMVEARELTNADLKALAGDSLTGADNASLIKQGLVDTDRTHRPFSHSLTDKGWHVAREIHQTPAPSGSATIALFTVLANVQRALERMGVSHAEFFKQGAETIASTRTEPASKPGGVELAIRDVYAKLADEPAAWVELADLRDQLGGFSRQVVDTALRDMAGKPDVRIIPIADSKNIGAREKKAALRIGVEDNHVIAIGQ